MYQEDQKVSLLGVFIWAIAASFYLYEFFLRTVIGTVANQIIPGLHLTPTTFALLGSSYYVAYAIMQIPVGLLTDKFGLKQILTFAIAICAFASFLFSHATGFYTAALSRFLMGFGSSFAFVCLLVIASNWFPKSMFGFFAGASQFTGTLGPMFAAGPLVSYIERTHSTWRYAMFETAIVGFVIAILAFLFVKNKGRDSNEESLIYLKNAEPIKKQLRRLGSNKQAWAIALFSACVYVPIDLFASFWGTPYLQAHGLSQSTAANIITLSWVSFAFSCICLGAASDYIKRRRPILIGCALLGLIATLAITYSPTLPISVYSILFFAIGIAASAQSLAFAVIAEHVDFNTKATALGLNNAMITGFSILIPPIMGAVISATASNIKHLQSHDFILGFSVIPLLYCFGLFLATIVIKETFCKPQKDMIVLKLETESI